MIFKERKQKYLHYVDALKGKFGDLASMIKETNYDIFSLRNQYNKEFFEIKLDRIQIGKFYLLLYNFNGNKLFCPIFTIDYRVKNNKNILYAINLDYLPFLYKKMFFNKLYSDFEQIFLFNTDADNALVEKTIPINFEFIYNALKDNGKYHYAISAFDVLKISECSVVSTNLMYLITHVHMRKVNITLMKNTMKAYEDKDFKQQKLKYTIEELEKMEESYDNDVTVYYKKLKQLENNYKLFENE